VISESLTIIGLGIADALNPFSIAAMAFLLTTDKPFERGATFIIGTLLVYFPGGIALMQGWTAVLKSILPSLPAWVLPAAYIISAIVCFGFAFYFFMQGRSKDGKLKTTPSNLSLMATLIFAIASTLSDLPTALPYFAAVNAISAASSGLVHELLFLTLYNLIYISPLIVMLMIRAWAGAKAQASLEIVRRAVDWSFVHLLPPISALLGAYLFAKGLGLI
jgi:cytochrome c biogenesis protein CcdA